MDFFEKIKIGRDQLNKNPDYVGVFRDSDINKVHWGSEVIGTRVALWNVENGHKCRLLFEVETHYTVRFGNRGPEMWFVWYQEADEPAIQDIINRFLCDVKPYRGEILDEDECI